MILGDRIYASGICLDWTWWEIVGNGGTDPNRWLRIVVAYKDDQMKREVLIEESKKILTKPKRIMDNDLVAAEYTFRLTPA